MDTPGRKKTGTKWHSRSSPTKSPPNSGPACVGTGMGASSVPQVIDLEPDSDDFEEPPPKSCRKASGESRPDGGVAKTPQTLEPRKVVLLSRHAQESKKPARGITSEDKLPSMPVRRPVLSPERTFAPVMSIPSENASSLPSTEEWDSQSTETKRNPGTGHVPKNDENHTGMLDNQKVMAWDQSQSTFKERDTFEISTDKEQSPLAKKKRNTSPILTTTDLAPPENNPFNSNVQPSDHTYGAIIGDRTEPEAPFNIVSVNLIIKTCQVIENGFVYTLEVVDRVSINRYSIRTGQHVSCLGLCEHIRRQLKYDGILCLIETTLISDSPSSSGQQLPLLCYPSEGPSQVRITNAEINILQSGLMLNDVLIQFYCLYLQNSRKYNAVKKSSFVSSFFFEKAFQLYQSKSEIKSVLKWKSSKDPLSNDYVFIPVNKALHWSLIILYKVTDEHADGALAYYLDSLGKCPMEIEEITKIYLAELKNAHGSPFRDMNCHDVFKTVRVPTQISGLGCGLYVLHYIEKFLEDPEYFIERVTKSDDISDWFNPEDAEAKRQEMGALIRQLINVD